MQGLEKGPNVKKYFRRLEIRAYLCHPNLGKRERGFINKALRVIDRYYMLSLLTSRTNDIKSQEFRQKGKCFLFVELLKRRL